MRSRAARSAATSVSARPANRAAEYLLVRRVGAGAGPGHPLQLGRVLDRAQHRQAVADGDERGRRQRVLQAQQVQRPGRVGDRVPPLAVQQRRGRRVRVDAVTPVHELTRRPGGRPGRVRVLERRHDHRRRPLGDEHQKREPLGHVRRVPAQVHQVRPRGDEQAGEAVLDRGPGRALHPVGVVLRGEGLHEPILGRCHPTAGRDRSGDRGAVPDQGGDRRGHRPPRRPGDGSVGAAGPTTSSATRPRVATTRSTDAIRVSSPTNAAAVVTVPSASR